MQRGSGLSAWKVRLLDLPPVSLVPSGREGGDAGVWGDRAQHGRRLKGRNAANRKLSVWAYGGMLSAPAEDEVLRMPTVVTQGLRLRFSSMCRLHIRSWEGKFPSALCSPR